MYGALSEHTRFLHCPSFRDWRPRFPWALFSAKRRCGPSRGRGVGICCPDERDLFRCLSEGCPETHPPRGRGGRVDEPGAAVPLLALMNIYKLTNRLAFDFDDVTRKGFAFDSIKGDFEFVNGDGSLKNFDVIAPAADINMFGSIGLLEQDYGLLMRVKPHTDSLPLAGGVLLGGVVVGVGLALIQKDFVLGVIGHNVYSITGGWVDP